MRIVVTGADGRLGAVIVADLVAEGHQVTGLSLLDLDITDAEAVGGTIGALRPDAVINCSAYTAVDAAETDPTTAFAVNAVGPSLLALAADAAGAMLVHFSTDFVFDGRTDRPYTEDAAPHPLGVYGKSKLAGEDAVRKARRHYVCRLESLFGGSGFRGHVATIDQIALGIREGRVVRAMADRTVSPSYAVDVALAVRTLLDINAPYGIYHCVNSGYSTWVEVAKEIGARLGIVARIEPVLSTDFKTAVERPRFCALSNAKLFDLGIEMPTWQSAVRRHIALDDE